MIKMTKRKSYILNAPDSMCSQLQQSLDIGCKHSTWKLAGHRAPAGTGVLKAKNQDGLLIGSAKTRLLAKVDGPPQLWVPQHMSLDFDDRPPGWHLHSLSPMQGTLSMDGLLGCATRRFSPLLACPTATTLESLPDLATLGHAVQALLLPTSCSVKIRVC